MDTTPVTAPMYGVVVSIDVIPGQSVPPGAPLLVLESMKMEHVVVAPVGGVVREVAAVQGEVVREDELLLSMEEREVVVPAEPEDLAPRERADLAEVLRRHEIGLDAARPEAVRRRRGTGHRTARENVADLCTAFTEYGALTVAAQRARRTMDELIDKTPADGLVAGVGDVNGRPAVVLAYDYTVLAGTQGAMNHYKKDRMLELADRRRLPVVLFAEGGGGRPGDTDTTSISGLDTMAFYLFARLSGQVPLVGIVAGRCFAGNAALLGCCDVVIATGDANIGMGGPAMIEGGGLGVFAPEEVGPMSVQVPNGVVDVPVADEAEAVRVAKRYLGYFQGPAAEWECADQEALRDLVPQDRKRVYDVRTVIETVADTGSVLELRRAFGPGVVTALARIEGVPVGLVANSPAHLGGAIDADGADKMSRFMKLCDAFGLPLVSLCDTPGFMVGPDAERTATVRHFSRMFVTGANLSVPVVTVILRKAYGLGAQAMAGGSLKVPVATVAWPTGELGGMGLEGAVRLGYRKELEGAEDSEALFDDLVARAYERGKALSAATVYEIDDVIDPAATRQWIGTALRDAPRGERRIPLDTW
ncbi:carboxyl transferase domain-containing protein [Actinomadura sp. DC4]|uniref:carboxyl transferase domain-containing protein n=1 Tax=Actinomadura sp. DC4 TaxID=3055069 RepID=UPI0025AFCDFD|nr:carboxyl transferase domain-containing protein [Actinomadura sp. DC4]MDN3357633.1 carboxyl transferase domain-containing protein [Actinomadura sp. DC4]